MPLEGSREQMFHEFRHGKTFQRTKNKHGAKTARKQMIAAVLNAERKGKKRHHSRSRSR